MHELDLAKLARSHLIGTHSFLTKSTHLNSSNFSDTASKVHLDEEIAVMKMNCGH